jgi:hypothetical protein
MKALTESSDTFELGHPTLPKYENKFLLLSLSDYFIIAAQIAYTNMIHLNFQKYLLKCLNYFNKELQVLP